MTNQDTKGDFQKTKLNKRRLRKSRSRTKELQENDIKTKEPKKSELKKNRERGTIMWRNMIFCTKKAVEKKGDNEKWRIKENWHSGKKRERRK